jgi:putative Mn2+ efflux pump MntP
MDALTLLFLAISLSMDAFAVSVCGGMRLSEERKFLGGLQYGVWFGIFQALMPYLGFYLGLSFASFANEYSHWIICLILGWIGIGMIRESSETGKEKAVTGWWTMLGLAVATSIDALGVGVGFAFQNVAIVPAVLEIGTITFCLSFLGCVFGSYIGLVGKEKAEKIGGLVLIGIGIKGVIFHFLG